MTITIDNPRRIQYVATAAQTNFAYNFKIFESGDLDVYSNGVLLTLLTEYTVTGVGVQTGGDIILITPATLDDEITINSNISDTQLTDYSVGGEFTGVSIETALDKLTTSNQQTNTLFETRGLTYEVTDVLGIGDTTIPALLEGEFWKKSAGGIVAASGDPSPDTLRSELSSQTISAPGSDLIGVFNTRTSTGETLTENLEKNTAPFDDDIPLVRDDADPTKQLRVDVGTITTGTTRVMTIPDRDIDLTSATSSQVQIGTDDINYLTSKSLTDGSGIILQRVESAVSAGSSTTLRIPIDNTIPQQTEGFEFTTVTITPKRDNTNLLIEYSVFTTPTVFQNITHALFRDSGADAIYTNKVSIVGARIVPLIGSFIVTSGSTAATTFKLRIGGLAGDGGTTHFNQSDSGTPLYGGTIRSYLRVTETIA